MAPDSAGRETVSLAITGMTCGACAARVERALNSVAGVDAHVNYASERATALVEPEVPLSRLIGAVADAGYGAASARDAAGADAGDDELDQRVRSLRRRLIVSAVLFMPLCDLSIFFSLYPSLRFPGWQALMIALALPVVTWAAAPFYVAAARAARHGTTTMDTLVSLGIVAATGWSLYTMFHLSSGSGVTFAALARGSANGIYFDVPAGVTTFLLAGRYFEAWSKRRSGNALRALANLETPEVTVVDEDGAEQSVPLAQLQVGDRFVVRPGGRVAADGEVLAGHAALDRSVMTGESAPLDVAAGDEVLGGTVSLDGRLVVVARRVGADSQLGRMIELVEHAQNERASVQRLADRICGVFVPVVIVIALGTLLAWLLAGAATDRALNASLSVLIIACPCALGLATPAALVAATWAGTRLGIFFKGYEALEASRGLDTVVFDKTGTLTSGEMRVCDWATADGHDRQGLLALAGAVERASEHPVARAIAGEAEREGVPLAAVDSFTTRPGISAAGSVDGRWVEIGRARSPGEDAELPAALAARYGRWQERGDSVVAVRSDGELVGLLALSDTVRPSAAAAVERLHALGLRCRLVTGDGGAAAHAVAAAVGIDDVTADALPGEKVELIRSLQAAGHRVAMVGDGVNDAPALAAADLGLAVGTGTDIALSAADLIIVRDDLAVTATAISLARRTLRTIRGNLAWAFVYNAIAIPLAAAGLLDPLIAGAAMALSSSFVVWNSSRLRRAVAADVPPPAKHAPPARDGEPGDEVAAVTVSPVV